MTDYRPELVDDEAWIAPTASVMGQVRIGALASIWFGAVLRGDVEPITIGSGSNVQDLCCLHADPGCPCILGERVTVGHGAIIHGAHVEDEVLIGMGAIVLNGARIGQHSIVGAGTLIPENRVIPPRSLVLGVPGRVLRVVSEQDIQKIRSGAQHYIEAAQQYRASASQSGQA